LRESFQIPYRNISTKYEVYLATQGNNEPSVTGNVTLEALNHTHDLPRQDDFAGLDSEVGGGAENKQIDFTRATSDRGSLLADFGDSNDTITLDTTVSGNDVKVKIANEDTVTTPVSSVSQADKLFDLSGDVEEELQEVGKFKIRNSFANNGEFEVVNAAFNGTFTEVTVASAIPDSTADGEAVISGVLSDEETISANDDTETTSTSYQDSELFIDILSANNTEPFELKSGGETLELQAASPSRFGAAKTEQNSQQAKVKGDDEELEDQDIVESVETDLLGGSTADSIDKVFLDPTPESGSNTEQEITSDLFNGANSGDAKARELDLLAAAKANGIDITSPGFKRLKLVPDDPTFLKSRVVFGHHKDSKNESGSSQ
jgi:hypothetical protein